MLQLERRPRAASSPYMCVFAGRGHAPALRSERGVKRVIIKERQSTHVYRQKQLFTKEELEARESLCVHEQSAYCNAACPLKLDTKTMVAAIAAGDFSKALQLYEKITPFPYILSAGCDAPCEGKCKLCSLGEGIAIRDLEAAALGFGERAKKRGLLRKKTKKVAVFGADLFSIFLAGELAKKMYPVTMYCAEADAMELIAACVPSLNDEAREASAADLKKIDIKFEWNADPVESFTESAMKYDLRCASFATAQQLYPNLNVDEAVMVCRDNNLITGKTEGVLGAAFGAKKAALSADRLAQNLDPSNTRGDEGCVETRLYTNLEGVAPSARIAVVDRETAIAEASRCICFVMNVTILFTAAFILSLKLKCNVIDSMFFKLFSDFMLYLVRFTSANNVHRCIVALSVH